MAIENRNLAPGTILVAKYKKQNVRAITVPEGVKLTAVGQGLGMFDLDHVYKSLSAAGAAITHSQCNGWRFFTRIEDVEGVKTGPKPRAAAERFWEHVDKNGPIPDFAPELGPCWLWTGAKDNDGYGNFSVEHNRTKGINLFKKAHTFAFEEEEGPLPDGLEPDHLCRVHACVRRSHLEAVTRSVNLRRGAGIGGALSDGSNPGSVAAAAARKARAFRVLKRTPNQKGLADGQVRYFCSACMKGYVAEGTIPDACPEGHRSTDEELTAPAGGGAE